MPYISAARALLLKSEATYGTAATLAPADVLLCRRIAPNPLTGTWRSRELVSPYGGASPEQLTGKAAGVEFDFEAAGSGTAGTAPAWADALLMCGWAETLTAGSDATYTPVDADFGSTTMRWRIGGAPGLAQTIAGARGALSFTARLNEFPYFTVNALGKYAPPANGAAPAITQAHLDAFKAPVAMEPSSVSSFSWGEVKLCATEFSFSDGRTPNANLYINCDAVDLGSRSFTGRMVVKMTEPGVKDLIGEAASALIQPGLFVFGTIPGNIIEIEAPTAQLKFAGFAEVGGDLAANVNLVFTRPGSAPEISIKVK